MLQGRYPIKHYYTKPIAKVSELPCISLRVQKTSRKSSVDEMFTKVVHENNADNELNGYEVKQSATIKKQPSQPESANTQDDPKRRSVSMAMRKLRKNTYSEDQSDLQSQKREVLSRLRQQVDGKILQQTIQLKKLELHRNHVNNILSSLLHSEAYENVKPMKLMDQHQPKSTSRKHTPLAKHKIGTIYDPSRFQDLYCKLKHDNPVRLNEGQMLTFKQFIQQSGGRLPKFFN